MAPGDAYHVERVLNNNVIVVRDAQGHEEVWMGRGLGFGVRRGQRVRPDDPRIERYFRGSDQPVNATRPAASNSAQESPRDDAVSITAALIRALLPEDWPNAASLNSVVHHAVQAVVRLRQGITIENPFMDETRLLYPETWALAERIARALEAQWQVVLPDEEVAFLTLHLRAARRQVPVGEAVSVTQAVERAVRVLEAECPGLCSRDDPRGRRLRVELRRAFERMVSGQRLVGLAVSQIEAEARPWLRLAERALAAGQVGVPVPREECAHLALWLARSGALAPASDAAIE